MTRKPRHSGRRANALALLACAGLLASCADPPTEVKTAAAGGILGGVVGGLVGGREGAIIGTAAGSLAGGTAGAYIRTRSADQEQLASLGPEYTEAVKRAKELDAPQIVILSTEIQPDIAFPGGDIELVVIYRVVAAKAGSSFKVEERRMIADSDGAPLWEGETDARLSGGAYRSTQLFTVPKHAQEGNYLYHAKLRAGPTEKDTPPVVLHIAAMPD